MPLEAAIQAGVDTVYVLAVSNASPPPDVRSSRAILRHSLTILLFPRIRLDALGDRGEHENLRVVKIPSGAAEVALWDMSRHTDLIEQGYEETANPRRPGLRRDVDRDASQITTELGLTVEAKQEKEATGETREAAEPRTRN